nr:retrovirus-related Pol polyprotein from transposon TNT 1-94 [Tanacetum cinerariifolium]
MTFEQIEEKFILVWEKMQDFVPMNSKLESERLKRPRIQLGKESFKKLKTAKASGTEPTEEQQSKEPKELSEEGLKKMIVIVPVEELYIEALQVKYPIIDWEIYSEDVRKYWKIIRVGNHTEVYQIFDEMLKKFDREDLDRLCSLVKETCRTTKVIHETTTTGLRLKSESLYITKSLTNKLWLKDRLYTFRMKPESGERLVTRGQSSDRGKGNNEKKPKKAAEVAIAKGDSDGDVYLAIDIEVGLALMNHLMVLMCI